jgi:Tfp pilus assembly protein FimT
MFNLDRKGFTFIDLLIVMAFMSILAAIIVPAYIGVQERGRREELVAVAEKTAEYFKGQPIDERKVGMVVASYINSNSVRYLISPWDKGKQLFIDGQINDTEECGDKARSNKGQIVICYTYGSRSIYLVAVSPHDTILINKLLF